MNAKLHPFFDPQSTFNRVLRPRDDRGAGTVVKLFHDLRRAALARYIRANPDDDAEIDWGYWPKVNQQLTDNLRRGARDEADSDTIKLPKSPISIAAASDVSRLLAVDLSLGRSSQPLPSSCVVPDLNMEAQEFTPSPPLLGWTDRIEVNIDGRRPNQRTPSDRWALIYFLARSALDELDTWLPQAAAQKRDNVSTVLHALDVESFTIDPAGRKLSYWWAAQPMLAWKTGPKGQLKVSVPLGTRCPALPQGSVILIALAPSDA